MTFMQKGSGSALGQQGLVSFMVTLIMMIVITLIVIGFTQVTIRARGEALDRQLSEQAFYAAESGVNKAVGIIKSAIAAGLPVDDQTNCGDATSTYATGLIGSSPNVAITCLLVNPIVEDIRFAADQTSSTVVLLETYDNNVTPSNPTKIYISWAAARGWSSAISDCSDYNTGWPQTIGSCGFGVLRLDLMHFVNNTYNIPPNTDLDDNTETFYLKPSSTAVPTGVGQKAHIAVANCSLGECRAEITLDNASFGNKKHYARVSMIYRDTPLVKIDGVTNNGHDASFGGAQVLVDSTGKAQDVLRRVQVRYPAGIIHSPTPPAALESEVKICKRFTVSPTSVDLDTECH